MDIQYLSSKASALHLAARSIAQGMRSGSFRSMYSGRGFEFAGVRDYLQGDDIRTIDWNVTARMGRPYIKLYNEERELIIFIILDASLSMKNSCFSKGPSPFEVGTELGTLLLLAGLQNNSPLGGVFFDGIIRYSSVPHTGKNQCMYLISQLEALSQQENLKNTFLNTKDIQGTALPGAIRGASKLLKNRSLVAVISDFKCGGYEDELARLGQKHDVVAFRIASPMDNNLPAIGTVSFVDPETQKKQRFSTSSSRFQKEWKEYNKNHLERWQQTCSRRGVTPVVIGTEQDYIQELIRFFSIKEGGR
jgi:uncharacterized protein (DUF58 family)